jgi:glyoxylase-like metal-dependent hydrolase (beta-lactamase superfamily II)
MRNRNYLYLGVAAAGLAGLALAQGPAPMPLVVHQIKPNVYWIEGGGGNSGVIVGDKGVIVVDAKTTAAAGKELLDDIAKITPKPVTTVIETHSDGDHVNGLASFPMGITIIAHENNKKEQDAAAAAGGRGGPPAGHLPTQIVSKNKEELKIAGVKIEALHWANAHTSGDLVVYLPAEKIVFTGDIITTQPDALIHLEKNGSSEGWVTTAKGIGALNADQFVPGHGNVLTKTEVQKKATDVAAKRAKIKDLVAQGKSLDEIRTAVGDPAPAATKGGGRGGPAFASFTEVVYQELTKKP